MTIYGPACTCPPTRKKIPHNAACPRRDDNHVWSIEGRAECQQQAEVAE